jgi:hypothetical protein
LLAPTLALTMLVVAGCGGSSKSGSTTTVASTPTTTAATATPPPNAPPAKVATGKPLARAQLIVAADAICARTNKKLSSFTVVTQHEFARELPQAVAYETSEVNELGKLVPPASLAHTWAQILGDFQLYNEDISRVTQYAQANKIRTAAPIIESSNVLHQKLNILAARTGFKHCSTQ